MQNNQMTQKIGFIGGGNMAHALITGMCQRGFSVADITVIELDAARRETLKNTLNVQTSDDLTTLKQADVIVLAVKPQQLKAVTNALKPNLNQQLIISIAAGIRLSDISRWLGNYTNIIRAMPNTPAQIQAGITGLCAMAGVSKAHIQTADHILNAVGNTVWVDDEVQLDAITAISGSGPAYVFYMIEALQDAAVRLGLSVDAAEKLSKATFKGASLLADVSTENIATLRAQVTSKGGTTEQGILSLEQAGLKQMIANAAKAAANRAKTLGDELGID